mmetsp:Transcript_9795/g.16040  ORF Transcript_9795/g.16040 Transcript_9795/m.16040 type:complete len:102 (-) Transcript_9795:1830-2135(-)
MPTPMVLHRQRYKVPRQSFGENCIGKDIYSGSIESILYSIPHGSSQLEFYSLTPSLSQVCMRITWIIVEVFPNYQGSQLTNNSRARLRWLNIPSVKIYTNN